MIKSTSRRTRPANTSNRGIGNLPWSYFVVIAICGCVIAAGFLLAARQHFVSMDLGMKNSKLRKQLEDLETEKRRLTLAREVALSPIEITRTARNLGFVEMNEPLLPVPLAAPGSANNAKAETAKAVKPNTPSAAGITKTASQRPTDTVAAREERHSKPATAPNPETRNRVIKAELTAIAKLR